jgi:WD40-like Beta Propeller Repeat
LDTGLTGTPEFQTATTDVSEVFFTENGDLYEYDVEHEQLDRLSEAAGVVGSLAGVSEDGSYVYFVANGVLAQGAEPGKCGSEFSPKTECDLYVLHGGRISLVAVLSGEDYHDWNPILPGLTARVAPDGRWLAFMSQRSLTGYDNRDALSGKPDEEVFLYDAGHEKLVCASCDPSGARPDGIEYGSLSTQSLVGSVGWESQQFLAANIPGWTAYSLGQALYQSRYLSDSGRLFFNSNEALTPQDVNGTWDVYEYEPSGAGNCSAGAVSFSERSDGCVAPISSGRSPEESGFIDASETGSDVFFLTAAKLAGEDYDTALDVYDAHECSGASPCLPGAAVLPPPCDTGDACKAAPSPQPAIFGAPASATFNGAGNLVSSGPASKVKARSLTRVQKLTRALRACKRKPKRERPVCERRARRAYGPVGGRAKRSNRRAG